MRIVVADDSVLLREGLVQILTHAGHEVLGQAGSADELVHLVESLYSSGSGLVGGLDLVVTDVRMPPGMGTDGLVAAKQLRDRFPALPLVVLSQYVAPSYATELLSSSAGSSAIGGVGYLLKDRVSRVADFLKSLNVVVAGGVVIDPEVAAKLISMRASRLGSLTLREKEVLGLMAQGLSNQQIAGVLVLSAGAVAKHVASVFTKLGLGPQEDNRRVRAVLTYLNENELNQL